MLFFFVGALLFYWVLPMVPNSTRETIAYRHDACSNGAKATSAQGFPTQWRGAYAHADWAISLPWLLVSSEMLSMTDPFWMLGFIQILLTKVFVELYLCLTVGASTCPCHVVKSVRCCLVTISNKINCINGDLSLRNVISHRCNCVS